MQSLYFSRVIFLIMFFCVSSSMYSFFFFFLDVYWLLVEIIRFRQEKRNEQGGSKYFDIRLIGICLKYKELVHIYIWN